VPRENPNVSLDAHHVEPFLVYIYSMFPVLADVCVAKSVPANLVMLFELRAVSSPLDLEIMFLEVSVGRVRTDLDACLL
jgi:hypothetical protein